MLHTARVTCSSLCLAGLTMRFDAHSNKHNNAISVLLVGFELASGELAETAPKTLVADTQRT